MSSPPGPVADGDAAGDGSSGRASGRGGGRAGGAEAGRKLIHVALSLVAAGVVWWLPARTAATILAGATCAALLVELARRASPRFSGWFHGTLGGMMRPRETVRLTGATTLSIGYTLAAVLLPGPPALVGILLTGVADAGAAIVGKRYGSIRYRGGKSVEGSLAFLVLATLILWSIPGLGIAAAVAAAVLVTLLEAPTFRVDDNLYLPLAAATAVAALARVFGLGGFS